jgi:outer membrane protein TolC
VKTAAAELDYNKKLWASNVIGFANYSGGNQNIVTNGSATGGTLSSSNVTTGLRVGLQVNLPLIELVGRKPRINSYKNTLNSTISKKAEAEQSIKQLVIDLYYKLIYSGNLLSIRSEAKQSAINQYSIAEKQFKDGIIEIGELSRLKTVEVNARADYEEAKRQFSTNYSEMEPLVGVDVQQLIIKK